MKRTVVLALNAVAMILLAYAHTGEAGEKVKSLRGDVPLAGDSVVPTSKAWQPPQQALIERNFADQPPLIPHAIDGFQITRENNTCLTCHSAAMAKATGAPVPKRSHFLDRDGKELNEISSRRYFCNQCHVRQTLANPLVENTYRPAAEE